MSFLCCGETFCNFCVFVVLVQINCGFFRWFYSNIVKPHFGTPLNLKSLGSWALVTGATDGIGKEYAKQLAKQGLNIILVSRTLSKLEAVSKEIRETFDVKTAVIDVDFTSGPEIYDKIRSKLEGKEIGILVNNVGMVYDAPDYFLNYPNREKFIQDIIRCNVTSMPMMCSIVMPQMVQRKRGLIINLSSLSAVTPGATLTLYAASKAFANKFSEDLAAEYQDQGIIVQSVLPVFVATNMLKIKRRSSIIPMPDKFVESALKTVGFSNYTSGFLPHTLITWCLQLIKFLSPSLSRNMTIKKLSDYRAVMIKRGFYVPENGKSS